MSRKYKFQNQDELYFISYAVVFWIDVFIRDMYKKVLLETRQYLPERKGPGDICIVHHDQPCTYDNRNKGSKLEEIVRDMKSHTSRSLKKAISENEQESRKEWLLRMFERAGKKNSQNKDFQFWQ